MVKEAFYFSHDSNALIDTKILNMRVEYGMEGYGLYWAIVETMRNKTNYKLEFSKGTFNAIKLLTNTNIDVEKFITDSIDKFKLFKKQENYFYSDSLVKRMNEMVRLKEKRSQAGSLGANIKKINNLLDKVIKGINDTEKETILKYVEKVPINILEEVIVKYKDCKLIKTQLEEFIRKTKGEKINGTNTNNNEQTRLPHRELPEENF